MVVWHSLKSMMEEVQRQLNLDQLHQVADQRVLMDGLVKKLTEHAELKVNLTSQLHQIIHLSCLHASCYAGCG
jgi:hypothetical protein